jgi:hypothetical protein
MLKQAMDVRVRLEDVKVCFCHLGVSIWQFIEALMRTNDKVKCLNHH